jgi:hypothetical protein
MFHGLQVFPGGPCEHSRARECIGLS